MIGGKAARRNINNIFVYFSFKTCLWVRFRARLMGNIARMGAMRKSRKSHSATGLEFQEVYIVIVFVCEIELEVWMDYGIWQL